MIHMDHNQEHYGVQMNKHFEFSPIELVEQDILSSGVLVNRGPDKGFEVMRDKLVHCYPATVALIVARQMGLRAFVTRVMMGDGREIVCMAHTGSRPDDPNSIPQIWNPLFEHTDMWYVLGWLVDNHPEWAESWMKTCTETCKFMKGIQIPCDSTVDTLTYKLIHAVACHKPITSIEEILDGNV